MVTREAKPTEPTLKLGGIGKSKAKCRFFPIDSCPRRSYIHVSLLSSRSSNDLLQKPASHPQVISDFISSKLGYPTHTHSFSWNSCLPLNVLGELQASRNRECSWYTRISTSGSSRRGSVEQTAASWQPSASCHTIVYKRNSASRVNIGFFLLLHHLAVLDAFAGYVAINICSQPLRLNPKYQTQRRE